MKNPYISLWLLLASAFAFFTVLSSGDTIEIGDIELAKPDIVEELTKTAVTEPADTEKPVADAKVQEVEIENESVMDTLPKKILLFGDSMLEGLSPRLAAYAEHNGHNLYSVIWYSSTSKVWGTSTKLKEYISKFKPDFIFVSLGANEMFVRDIIKKRDKYVKNILSQIGDIPYIWIGPPNWKEDTGINELVRMNVPEGRFFLSNGMHFDRAKDNVHPTRASAALWMDSVINWMAKNRNGEIRLAKPAKASGKADKTITLQPVK
jgi:hypothetical protein